MRSNWSTMTNQCNCRDDEKLNKLLEALQNKAPTFYSNLPANVYENYSLVKKEAKCMVCTKRSYTDSQKPTESNSAETRKRT